jgi:dihydropteroate synthase
VKADEFLSWLKDHSSSKRGRTLVMGILNVTPDSFSDGGKFYDPAAAMAHAHSMAADGADLIDIGGESTRPGSLPVEASEQIRRVLPVIKAIRRELPITISIDTTRAILAQAALDAGADIINDISAGRDDPEMLPLAATRNAPIILMHMQGKPTTMQHQPSYQDVTSEVAGFFVERLQTLRTLGIDAADVLIDPGLGFGKTVEHNLQLLRDLPKLAAIGRPMVVGVSRKSFLAKITGDAESPDRPFGTAAAVAWCATNGAAIVRVHDVKAMSTVVRLTDAIRRTT